MDVSRRKDVRREAAHALDEVTQPVVARMNGPDDIPHGGHRLAAGARHSLNQLHGARIRPVQRPPGQFAQHRHLGKTGTNIVVQVGSNTEPDSFQSQHLVQLVTMQSVGHGA